MEPRSLLIHVVTFNSSSTIVACLRSLLALEDIRPDIIVTDNASTDGTAEAIRSSFESAIAIRQNACNLGFSAAHNQVLNEAIRTGRPNVLIANPDVLLDPACARHLIAALHSHARVGSATPRICRTDEHLAPTVPLRLDGAGMFITPSIRHFDRGSEELDIGQYAEPEFVFGGTGAVALYKREFLEDVASGDGEIFDEAFFAYREDADLSWRGQTLGWQCLYEPRARAWHRRTVLPSGRRTLNPLLNRLGVQNRFLLQLKNYSALGYPRCILPAMVRNLLVVGAVFAIERTSLPALLEVIRRRGEMRTKRKALRERARAVQVSRWFRATPSAEPALRHEPAEEPIRSVAVVIVNYNSGDRLQRAMRALLDGWEKLDIEARVIVFDNASHDESLHDLPVHPALEVIRWNANRGFAGAVNDVSRRFPADAVLVMNPDVEITARALGELVPMLDRMPNCGALAPLLVDRSGEPQLDFVARRLPTVSSTLAECFSLARFFPRNPWTAAARFSADRFVRSYLLRSNGSSPAHSLDRPIEMPQPPASCILFRSAALRDLGGFDERFYPAWFEDVDLFRRMYDSPWRAAVTSSVCAIHEGGYSRGVLDGREFLVTWYRNLSQYWEKHGSAGQRVLLRVALPMAFLLRAFLPQSRIGNLRLRSSLGFAYRLLRGTAGKWPVRRVRGTRAAVALPALASMTDFAIESEVLRDWRTYFMQQLTGRGVELGALHRPAEVHRQLWVDYVDRLTLPELRRHYPELAHEDLVAANIIDDAETLSTIADETYDCLIASHVIEHMRNPILALTNWSRVVKPGGLIYLVVPDKRATFDRRRPLTTLEHMVLDYEAPSPARDFGHHLEYAVFVDGARGSGAVAAAKRSEEIDYSIHYHVFSPENFLELISWVRRNVCALRLREGPVKSPGSYEFHLLLERRRQRSNSLTLSSHRLRKAAR